MGITYLIKIFCIDSKFKYIGTEQFKLAVTVLTFIREILGSILDGKLGSINSGFP
jgi:hypothetical protein